MILGRVRILWMAELLWLLLLLLLVVVVIVMTVVRVPVAAQRPLVVVGWVNRVLEALRFLVGSLR